MSLADTNSISNSSISSSSARTVWFLVGRVAEMESIRHIPIHSTPYVIGRRSDAMLSIPDLKVSSLHAEISEFGKKLLITDMGSTNGTYVNGQRIDDAVQLDQNDLVMFGDTAFRVLCQDVVNSSGITASEEDVYDRALALVQFDKLLSGNGVVPHYQPIVELISGETVGYEVLGRSRILGLETASDMFRAAAKLNMEVELSNMLRWKGVEMSQTFPTPPSLFVNAHPAELNSDIIGSLKRLRKLNFRQELTLEIHEAAVTESEGIRELRTMLHDLGIKLAYDDFGAGQERLRELAESPPDYLKFDISLTQGLHEATGEKQRVVATLVQIVRDLDVIPLAEGIEIKEDADTCRQLGFQLVQGFYFGKPIPIRYFQSS